MSDKVKKSEVLVWERKWGRLIFDFCCQKFIIKSGDIAYPEIVISDSARPRDSIFNGLAVSAYDVGDNIITINPISIIDQVDIRKINGCSMSFRDSFIVLLAEEVFHYLHCKLSPVNLNEILVNNFRQDATLAFCQMAIIEALAYRGVIAVVKHFKIDDGYYKDIEKRTSYLVGATQSFILPARQNPQENLPGLFHCVIRYLSCKLLASSSFSQLKDNCFWFARQWNGDIAPVEKEEMKKWVADIGGITL